MQDLTKITTPFGLLDTETQEALKAHDVEVYDGPNGWCHHPFPTLDERKTYRVKPAPPKPREWWITHEAKAYKSQQGAFQYCHGLPIIHVREVL